MSCEYCPPKSRTTTSSTARGACTSVAFSSTTCGAARDAVTRASVTTGSSSCECRLGLGLRVRGGGRPARPHPDLLRALELLALGLQRRRDHQLRAVELRDVAVTARRHRGPQPAHEIERAVVLVGRAGEDL